MRDAIETYEQEGFKAEVVQDTEPMSPKDWDNVGTLVTWHRHYCFDEDGKRRFGEPEAFLEEAATEGWTYLPVAMIDHSGISLYEGSGAHAMDPGGWDSGQVGYIYATRHSVEKCMGTGMSPAAILEALRAELKTWDQYVTGDVYGWIVTGPDGEERESCWGCYGLEYAKEEAQSQLKAAVEHEKQEAEKIGRMMAL